MHEIKTFFITTFPSLPAFFAAVESPSARSVLTAFIMPCFFFAVSKTVDVLFQLWKVRREERRKNATE
jgi:hypothetical protein